MKKSEYEPKIEMELGSSKFDLVRKYRERCEDCNCSEEALIWYQKGIQCGQICKQYEMHNFHHYYYERCYCEEDTKKAKEFYLKAIECFRHSAEEGNDIAMTIYGMFIYWYGGKARRNEAVTWFLKASELGLAIADYFVACCYHHGEGVKKDQIEAERYYLQFQERLHSSQRQEALAYEMDFDMKLPYLYRLYNWCHGSSFIGANDYIGFHNCNWDRDEDIKAECDFGLQLDTNVYDGVPGDDYFLYYYYNC